MNQIKRLCSPCGPTECSGTADSWFESYVSVSFHNIVKPYPCWHKVEVLVQIRGRGRAQEWDSEWGIILFGNELSSGTK